MYACMEVLVCLSLCVCTQGCLYESASFRHIPMGTRTRSRYVGKALFADRAATSRLLLQFELVSSLWCLRQLSGLVSRFRLA